MKVKEAVKRLRARTYLSVGRSPDDALRKCIKNDRLMELSNVFRKRNDKLKPEGHAENELLYVILSPYIGSSVYAGGACSFPSGVSPTNFFCSSSLITQSAEPHAVDKRKNIDAMGTNCNISAIVPNLHRHHSSAFLLTTVKILVTN